MSPGERAAIEGILSQLRPKLAVEIGTAEGGSLDRIAAHSAEVHAVDLTGHFLVALPANATFHEGDSKRVLPELLAELAAAGRKVDFALVDGDHTAEGARADLEALLASSAVEETVILLHDSYNPDVRAGIEAAGLADHPKVAGFDLDFVPGRLGKIGGFADQFLGGFALVVVSGEPVGGVELGLWSLKPDPILFHDAHQAASRVAALAGAEPLQVEMAGAERLPLEPAPIATARLRGELDAITSSVSWRITAPLRALGALLRGTRT